jgi:hypothetical protein
MLCWCHLNDSVAEVVHVDTCTWRGALVIFRGLPPFLRLTRLLGLLCILTSMVLAGWMLATALVSHFAAAAGDFQRLHILGIVFSLLVLGIAFTFLSNAYRSHERSPDTTGFPFHSWQEQARFTALLAALPICAFVLALVVPPDPFGLIAWLVAFVALVVCIMAYARAASWPVDDSPT